MEAVGFAAVVLSLGIPFAAIYAWYRVRRLRTEERLAALAKGVAVPFADELPPHARSCRAGILLTAGALGYILTFMALARFEPQAMEAAVFGIIPLAIGIGYFIDYALVRRESQASA
ncbi:MAG TPA: DUF6249 domain-containing protein [Candidatus Limnocylindrales bacterium]|nr:DUF6249 domain-containing protein [Candidatus Limnocylindrales bacterium]